MNAADPLLDQDLKYFLAEAKLFEDSIQQERARNKHANTHAIRVMTAALQRCRRQVARLTTLAKQYE